MSESRDYSKEFPTLMQKAYKQYKRYQKVTEIMSTNVFTTTPEATMYNAAKTMGERHIGSLIVVKYQTHVGIVTERDLLSNVLAKERDPKEVKVESVMSYPLITICSTATIREAAQMMIKKKGRLTVFECGDLIGIVTASDLIRSLPEAPETEVKTDDFMTRKVVTADKDSQIGKIAKVMGEQRIGSVIVTSKGKPIGIFTERDLLTTFLARDKPLTTLVGEVCSSPLVSISPGLSVHEAAYTMASNHVRRLPIAKDEEIIGIITARDLVEAYAT